MLPSIALQTHREAIRRIALSHRVTNVRVFGSVVGIPGDRDRSFRRIVTDDSGLS